MPFRPEWAERLSVQCRFGRGRPWGRQIAESSGSVPRQCSIPYVCGCDHRQSGPQHVHPDELNGKSREMLPVADRSLEHDDGEKEPGGASLSGGGVCPYGAHEKQRGSRAQNIHRHHMQLGDELRVEVVAGEPGSPA